MAHVVHIEGWKMKRAYDLCDVCRPQFFRLMRRMVGGETEASNVNLRTQSVTFATKAKAEAANVHSQDRVGGMA